MAKILAILHFPSQRRIASLSHDELGGTVIWLADMAVRRLMGRCDFNLCQRSAPALDRAIDSAKTRLRDTLCGVVETSYVIFLNGAQHCPSTSSGAMDGVKHACIICRRM